MTELQQIIEAAFERRDTITPGSVDSATKSAILQAIDLLDSGKARVAEKIAGEWVVHQWLKKAVLLYFRINDNGIIKGDDAQYYVKVPPSSPTTPPSSSRKRVYAWCRRQQPAKALLSPPIPC